MQWMMKWASLVFLLAFSASSATEGSDFGPGVAGWRLGPERAHGGFAIYRQARHGWTRVPGAALKLGGSRRNPWAINSRQQIFFWQRGHWQRMPGAAIDVGDGWVIGTRRERGGYAIYRWNGYGWDQAPGAAVRIGGSYERPWVVNNRGQRFVWNGFDWDPAFAGRGFDRSSRPGFITEEQGYDRLRPPQYRDGFRDRRPDHDSGFSRGSRQPPRRSDW